MCPLGAGRVESIAAASWDSMALCSGVELLCPLAGGGHGFKSKVVNPCLRV